MNGPTAIYPGTADPITYGHMDVVRRAAALFPRVIVLVARNTVKTPLFSAQERLAMVRQAFRGERRIRADCFDGLLVAYARAHGASVLVRGLRAVSDFEYEFQMAGMNYRMAPDYEKMLRRFRVGHATQPGCPSSVRAWSIWS